MVVLVVCLLVIILIVIVIYNRGRSDYDINWDNLELSKTKKLESNCFTIVKNMSLMNHNKLILIPSYFNNPEIIVDTTQILCLKFTFGNYIWINFAGTYLGATLVDAFDIRYTPINMGFNVHRGF